MLSATPSILFSPALATASAGCCGGRRRWWGSEAASGWAGSLAQQPVVAASLACPADPSCLRSGQHRRGDALLVPVPGGFSLACKRRGEREGTHASQSRDPARHLSLLIVTDSTTTTLAPSNIAEEQGKRFRCVNKPLMRVRIASTCRTMRSVVAYADGAPSAHADSVWLVPQLYMAPFVATVFLCGCYPRTQWRCRDQAVSVKSPGSATVVDWGL